MTGWLAGYEDRFAYPTDAIMARDACTLPEKQNHKRGVGICTWSTLRWSYRTYFLLLRGPWPGARGGGCPTGASRKDGCKSPRRSALPWEALSPCCPSSLPSLSEEPGGIPATVFSESQTWQAGGSGERGLNEVQKLLKGTGFYWVCPEFPRQSGKVPTGPEYGDMTACQTPGAC